MKNTACFIGHRKTADSEQLRRSVAYIIEDLIVSKGVNTFLFGSKSKFDDICLETVTELQTKYPHIKRIYVRSYAQHIDKSYYDYLLTLCDDTYFPEKIANAGKAIYVERNREMIDKSRFCIFYYDKTASPKNRKSGTEIALFYALKKEKEIVILPLDV